MIRKVQQQFIHSFLVCNIFSCNLNRPRFSRLYCIFTCTYNNIICIFINLKLSLSPYFMHKCVSVPSYIFETVYLCDVYIACICEWVYSCNPYSKGTCIPIILRIVWLPEPLGLPERTVRQWSRSLTSMSPWIVPSVNPCSEPSDSPVYVTAIDCHGLEIIWLSLWHRLQWAQVIAPATAVQSRHLLCPY